MKKQNLSSIIDLVVKLVETYTVNHILKVKAEKTLHITKLAVTAIIIKLIACGLFILSWACFQLILFYYMDSIAIPIIKILWTLFGVDVISLTCLIIYFIKLKNRIISCL
jgi:hypothetical protein